MEKQRFITRLKSRIPTRWHMSVICATTIAGGVLFDRALLYLHLKHPVVRYPIAVAASYAIFYFMVYLWLRWQFPERRARPGRSLDDSDVVSDLLDVPVNLPDPEWKGSGGSFAGAGASGSWGDADADTPASSKGVAGALSSVDKVDDDGAVVIFFLLLIAAIFGSAFYLVYAAPEILLDAGFDFVLATGLLRRTKKMHAEGWEVSILKRTWIAATIVLALALICGAVLKSACPAADSLGDYQRLCQK